MKQFQKGLCFSSFEDKGPTELVHLEYGTMWLWFYMERKVVSTWTVWGVDDLSIGSVGFGMCHLA